MLRAPRFWFSPPGAPRLAARFLAPAAALWGVGARLRQARGRPEPAPVPVICVGNLTVGGAGKTPTVIALLSALSEAGWTPHALSRGYGGVERGPHRVDPEADPAERVGDEPLLLAAFAPTWVARDRLAGARAAAAAGADVIVMDDGFQDPRLRKDLSILVIDSEQGFGNGRLIPAGPLREPVAQGLARADAALLIGTRAQEAALRATWPELKALPLLRGRIAPLPTGLPLDGAPVVAFAGIGHPEKFFATLRALGADLRATHAFPDHAAYSPAILRRLAAEARGQGAALVTTEKDSVRLPRAFRREAMAVPVRLELAEPATLVEFLEQLPRIRRI
jgi:tetraacyldisaccharide 4'-kinase